MVSKTYDVDPSFWEDVVITFPDPRVISSAPWKSAWMIEKEKAEREKESATASDVQKCHDEDEVISTQDSFDNSQIVFENVRQEKVNSESASDVLKCHDDNELISTQDSLDNSQIVFESVRQVSVGTGEDVAGSANSSPDIALHSQSVIGFRDISPVSADAISPSVYSPLLTSVRNDSVNYFDEAFDSRPEPVDKVECSQCASQFHVTHVVETSPNAAANVHTPRLAFVRNGSVDSFDEPFDSRPQPLDNVECSQCGTQSQVNQGVETSSNASHSSQLASFDASSAAPLSQLEMGSAMFNGNRIDLLLCEKCIVKNKSHKEHKNPAEFHRKTLYLCDACRAKNVKAASIRDEKKRKAENEGECSKKRKK